MSSNSQKPESSKKKSFINIITIILSILVIALTFHTIRACMRGTQSLVTGTSSNNASTNSANDNSTSANQDSTNATTASSNDTAIAAEILESGYFITRHGNLKYGVVWQNPSEKYTIYAPTLLIIGKDSAGKELFSETNKRPIKIYPHEKQIFAGSISKNDVRLHSIEFKSMGGSFQNDKTQENGEFFTLSNQQEGEHDTYSKLYTCQLTVNKTPPNSNGYIFYDIILRDEQGNIVFGDTVHNVADNAVGNTISASGSSKLKIPEQGTSTECEFKLGTPDLFGGVPEHASFEIGATAGCNP